MQERLRRGLLEFRGYDRYSRESIVAVFVAMPSGDPRIVAARARLAASMIGDTFYNSNGRIIVPVISHDQSLPDARGPTHTCVECLLRF